MTLGWRHLAVAAGLSFLFGIALHTGVHRAGSGHVHGGAENASAHDHPGAGEPSANKADPDSQEWSNSPLRVELDSTAGGRRSFPDDYESNRYLVNFWATWCPPCVHELPLLSEYNASAGGSDLQVLGIAIDDPAKVADFIERTPLSFESLLPGPSAFGMLPRREGEPPFLPASFLVDLEGNVLAQKSGPFANIEEIAEFVRGEN